ncbi:MAG TPA: VIT and VWA domain-containing protein [Vicinamibacterales bacterium]|nr:VIT and VWA domain-containing protein [Vicinamibacterales bacterium]
MPTTEPTPASRVPAGLLAAGTPVPLEGVSVNALVTSASARVTIAQRYRNQERQPIEAVYVFPLDEGAAVCGFEAVTSGVHYVGEVRPRDEAFRVYDEALLAGHGAYLLDEERPDVFTASIGNLPPGAEVLIRLTYVTELATEGNALRFTLPTTVSPRYAPHEDRVGIGRSPDTTLNPPVAWRVPYGLDLTIALDLPGAITRVESPSHPIGLTLDGARATVTLAQTKAALDRDVVVLIEAQGLDAPHAIVETTASGEQTAVVVFQPRLEAALAPADVVFVVDRSGSMKGTSIEEVRNALQLCLRSLVPGSRFDIVGFGDRFVSLFGNSVPYDETTLARAAEHVALLQADLGGTEILPTLQAVFDRPRSELPRQLVIFTDGEVTNTDAVLALIGRQASHSRVFTFGIGRGASAHLVRGMARAGHGAAELIYAGERLEAKVLRQFSRVMTPALTDVTVDWSGLAIRTAPTIAPAVFAGGRVLVYAWLRDARPGTVTLSARGPRGTVSHTVTIDPGRAAAGTTVASLAARTRIRELEEGQEWLARRGSQQIERHAGQVREEIVRLACAYHLASRETSFIAVEQREVPVEGEVQLLRIPVALTSGWGGVDEQPRVGGNILALHVQDWDATNDAPGVQFLRRSEAAYPPPKSTGASQLALRVGRSLREPFSRESPGQRAARPPLDAVVALQRADGSWELTEKLARAVGVEWTHLTSASAEVSGTPDHGRIWATMVALAWLARHADESRDEWQLLAQKAEGWLSATVRDQASLARWRQAADALVNA